MRCSDPHDLVSLWLAASVIFLIGYLSDANAYDFKRLNVGSGSVRAGVMGLRQAAGVYRSAPQSYHNVYSLPERRTETVRYQEPVRQTHSRTLDRKKALEVRKNLAYDKSMRKGWTWCVIFIHDWTFKPLYRMTNAYVDWVYQTFADKDIKSKSWRFVFVFLAPVIIFAILWAVIRIGVLNRRQVIFRALVCWTILWVAYDGGYSFLSSCYSLLKGLGYIILYSLGTLLFLGAGAVANAAYNSTSSSSSSNDNSSDEGRSSSDWSSSSSSSSSSGSSGSNEEVKTYREDNLGREYVGKGKDPDVYERTTPGDTATFDRGVCGEWHSRYTDEVIRDPQPGD